MRRRAPSSTSGPAPRGGDGNTVGATGGGDNQTSGASFRIIVDLADWENAVGINTPGQSGNPDDPHYRDLFPLWANDRYFGVPFAKDRVAASGTLTVLRGQPATKGPAVESWSIAEREVSSPPLATNEFVT